GALSTIGEARAGLMAFEAGVDHLLFRFDESAQIEGHRLIVDALRSGRIAASRLDDSASRVLRLKSAQGLYQSGSRPTPDLGTNAQAALDLARRCLTVLQNEGLLPRRAQ